MTQVNFVSGTRDEIGQMTVILTQNGRWSVRAADAPAAADPPRREAAEERAARWLARWSDRLRVPCPVRLERMSRWHVSGADGRPGCSLVGVYVREGEGVLVHTRRLTEEDIVHELLHVAHPQWSEAQVVAETARLLGADERAGRRRLPRNPHRSGAHRRPPEEDCDGV